MKNKLIIDNRTDESIQQILSMAKQFIDKQTTKIKMGTKQIYCSMIKNEKSERLLFTYEKITQEQLF